jgi:myo-inositol 2-dehydrogenase/D-chiro-inositol 1-dehydrogenase
MLRVAVLGCGRIGKMHARNIKAHSETSLVAVYDINAKSAASVAEDCSTQSIDNIDEIFESDKIDALLVASSTATHADYIERAVQNGKPVLCEKPIDLSLNRVNRTAEIIKNTKVQVQLGFNRRFDPGHQAAKKAVVEGKIGDLHQVIITSRDPEMPPRSYYEDAGGLLRDMTIHDFDLARFMLDDEPVDVFAVAGGLIDPALMNDLGDHDSAMIVMRTEDGKQCFINNSRTAVYGYDQRVELLGTNGMVQSNNRKPHEMQTFSKKASAISEPYQFFFLERYSESFMAEISSFVDSIRNDKPAKVGFEDGRKALILAEAAYISLEEKRLVKVTEVAERK